MSKKIIPTQGNKIKYVDITKRDLQDKEVRIKNVYIGMNFHDIDFKNGHINGENLSLGCEAVGEVLEAHSSVKNVKEGDMVVYGSFLCGSYTQEKIINSNKLIKIPTTIAHKDIAAIFYKAVAAHFLVTRTYRVNPKTIAFVTCAASGMGMLITQMLKSVNVKVIGIVGSQEKIDIARENGCDLVFNYKTDKKFAEYIFDFTKGCGVDVVYDSLGGEYTNSFIKLLGPFGLLVNYGNSSGYNINLDTHLLRQENKFFTNPILFKNYWERKLLSQVSKDIFMLLEKKYIHANISAECGFDDIINAHKRHEEGKSTGSTIITCE